MVLELIQRIRNTYSIKTLASVIVFVNLSIIVIFQKFFISNRTIMHSTSMINLQFVTSTYELTKSCERLNKAMFNNDTVNYSPQRLATSYPWLNTSIFLVESESLMYCSVPKVASKTFISVITYVYIRSIINQVNYNHRKDILDAHLLIRELRTVRKIY